MKMRDSQLEKPQSKPEPNNSVLKMANIYFKAVLPMKFLILYLGFNATEEPTALNIIILLAAISFSFGSLIIYAIKSE